jgi:Rieske Fe-S protein
MQVAPLRTFTRRNFLKLSFWTGIGIAIVGGGASLANALYPRRPDGVRAPVLVHRYSQIPLPTEPPRFHMEGNFFMVSLPDPAHTLAPHGRLLALSAICPHLACTVVWESESEYSRFDQLGSDPGAMVCHCHLAVFTRTGARTFGPARRGMDTLRIEILPSGDLAVHPQDVTPGDDDNASRAIPWPPDNS